MSDENLKERREKRSESWSLYPLFLQKPGEALIIGGGEVGARKALNLAGCGWIVHVISEDFHPNIRELIGNEAGVNIITRRSRVQSVEIELKMQYYQKQAKPFIHVRGDQGIITLEGDKIRLVFCCTDDAELNRELRTTFQENGFLVNCSDDPENSDFINGAVVRKNELTIAISSNGKDPGLMKKLKCSLSELLGKITK